MAQAALPAPKPRSRSGPEIIVPDIIEDLSVKRADKNYVKRYKKGRYLGKGAFAKVQSHHMFKMNGWVKGDGMVHVFRENAHSLDDLPSSSFCLLSSAAFFSFYSWLLYIFSFFSYSSTLFNLLGITLNLSTYSLVICLQTDHLITLHTIFIPTHLSSSSSSFSSSSILQVYEITSMDSKRVYAGKVIPKASLVKASSRLVVVV